MAETIESFVAKLQAEGVEAGQRDAEKLRAEAQKQAQAIVAQARQEAEKILADAKAQADGLLQRGRTELDLAARDTVLKLRDALGRALCALLTEAAREQLTDPQFISRLLHDLAMLYAESDIEDHDRAIVSIPSEMASQLTSWVLDRVKRTAEGKGMRLDLQTTLAGEGFEYNVAGATIEMTVESVVELLCQMVNPKLEEVLRRAVSGAPEEK